MSSAYKVSWTTKAVYEPPGIRRGGLENFKGGIYFGVECGLSLRRVGLCLLKDTWYSLAHKF